MAEILPLPPPRPRAERADPPPRDGAEILFFTGVRYERHEEEAEPDPAPRRPSGALSTRSRKRVRA